MILVLSCAQDLTAVNIQVEIPLDLKKRESSLVPVGLFRGSQVSIPNSVQQSQGIECGRTVLFTCSFTTSGSPTDASDESSGMSSETGFEHIEPETLVHRSEAGN